MFVRRIQTRSTASGDRYFTFRLVHSERVALASGNVPCSISGATSPSRRLIGRWLCPPRTAPGPANPDPCHGHSHGRAGSTAHRRTIARPQVALRSLPNRPAALPSACSTAVASLELLRPRSVGVEQVALWAMEQVRLIPVAKSGTQRSATRRRGWLDHGRMAAIGSERATYRWTVPAQRSRRAASGGPSEHDELYRADCATRSTKGICSTGFTSESVRVTAEGAPLQPDFDGRSCEVAGKISEGCAWNRR